MNVGFFNSLGMHANGGRCRVLAGRDARVPATFRKCREIYDFPLFGALLLSLTQQPSGEVVFVPAGLDEDDRAVGFETGVDVVGEPVIYAIAKSFAFSL